MTNKNLVLIIILVVFTITAGCSDNSSDPDLTEDSGQGSFSISGDVQASFEGEAFFATIGAGGFFTANITITDDEDQESFALVLTTSSTSAISVPAGTYRIGLPESELIDGSVFIASLTDFTGDIPKVFQTAENNAGTLTISRSTDRTLEGTFRYDAGGDSGEEVTVEGSFSAVK